MWGRVIRCCAVVRLSETIAFSSMTPNRNLGLAGLLLAVAASGAGCQWVGFTSHVTPQVSGRVLDADTRCPLAGVKVLRVLHGQVENPPTPVHGAQLMQQERPVTTNARGEFIYPGKSYFTILNEANWWTLTLSF